MIDGLVLKKFAAFKVWAHKGQWKRASQCLMTGAGAFYPVEYIENPAELPIQKEIDDYAKIIISTESRHVRMCFAGWLCSQPGEHVAGRTEMYYGDHSELWIRRVVAQLMSDVTA